MKGSNSIGQPVKGRTESAGVGSGLSDRSDFMSDQTMSDSSFNESGSKASGYTRQVKGKRSSKSVSEKGYSFELEG